MKSEFKVTCQYLGERKVYAIFRHIDVNAIDHSGNREVVTPYMEITRDQAQKIADSFNRIAKEG